MDTFFKEINNDNFLVEIRPELLNIEGYRQIWDTDKSKTKTNARKKLTYVFGMCCKDSSVNWYADINNLDERSRVLKDHLWEAKKYDPKIDSLVIDAVKVYRKYNPKNEYDLQAEFTQKQIEDIREMLNSIGFNEVDKQGKLKLTPKDRSVAVTELDKMVKQLDDNKQRADEKRRVQRNIRGGGEEGMYEDPDNVPTN